MIVRFEFCALLLLVNLYYALLTPTPPKDLTKLIDNKFQIKDVLGHGQYGIVYSGIDVKTNRNVAIKFSYHEYSHHLKEEYDFQRKLANTHGVAKAHYCGKYDSEYSVLVMDRLGHDISPYVPPRFSRLPADTILKLAASLMQTFEEFHDKGLLHRDIKPDNIAFGLNKHEEDDKNEFFLFDFNRCSYYKNTTTGMLYPPKKSHPTRATSYTPPNLVEGKAYSRRDDMLALGYVLVHLTGTALPWDCYHSADAVKIMKKTSDKEIVGSLPEAFRTYFDHVSSLGYYDRPDYQLLKHEFLTTDSSKLQSSMPWLPKSLCLVYY